MGKILLFDRFPAQACFKFIFARTKQYRDLCSKECRNLVPNFCFFRDPSDMAVIKATERSSVSGKLQRNLKAFHKLVSL